MAFLIHAVSTAATGREIRRSRRIEEDRATIGRDPASDIHLADLEVTLNHAELVETAPHRLAVRALAGIPFSIDGRSTLESEVDARAGAEVRIGGFRLMIGWDEEARAIGVTVERFGLLAASSDTRDERELFTLAGVAPSRRTMAWAGAVLVLLVFLAWPIGAYLTASNAKLTPKQMAAGAAFHGDRSWSAGPLSAAHASLAGNCTACHAKAFVSIRDESCKTCHQTVHDHADPEKLRVALAPNTVGGKLSLAVAHVFNRPAGRCVDCHSEHKGATAALEKPDQKFCADCHGALKAKLPDTRLGNAADFGKEHPQFQPAILVRAGAHPSFQRTSLDAKPRQDEGLVFPHDLHLSATNGVARMAQALGQVRAGGLQCAGCHQPERNGGAGFRPITMEQDCQSCHSLAFGRREGEVRTLRHGNVAQAIAQVRDFYAAGGGTSVAPLSGFARRRPGDFAAVQVASLGAPPGAGQAIRALFSTGGACADCHRVSGPSRPGALDYRIAPVSLQKDFYVNGWFDHRAHGSTTEACEDCHVAAKSRDARDVLIPGIANCRTCHVGESAPIVSAKKQVASNCAMCHVYHRDDTQAATAARRGPATKKHSESFPTALTQPFPDGSVKGTG